MYNETMKLQIDHNTGKYLPYVAECYAPINVKPAGEGVRRGMGRDFDIFQKIAAKFPTPGQKFEVKHN